MHQREGTSNASPSYKQVIRHRQVDMVSSMSYSWSRCTHTLSNATPTSHSQLPLSLLNAAVAKPMVRIHVFLTRYPRILTFPIQSPALLLLHQLVELKNGETYNGHLVDCDNFMNITLRDVYLTSAEGDRFWKLKEVYLRGNVVSEGGRANRIPRSLWELLDLTNILRLHFSYRLNTSG